MSLAESLFQRIADFLDDHPPFQYLSKEDLLSIARMVKIRFHEKDEVIFEAGTLRKPYFLMVHNGSVRVFNRQERKHELRDIRVEGELIGMGHLASLPRYTQTAVAESDAILYTIPWQAFSTLVSSYPDVWRFLRANTTTRSGASGSGGNSIAGLVIEGDGADTLVGHIHETTHLPQIVQKRFVSCQVNDTLQEAAFQMLQNDLEAVIVVDREGYPKGMITKTDMTRCVQSGRLPRKALAKEFMSAPVITVASDPRLGDCLKMMLKNGCRYLCMTRDGTPLSPAVGVISERDLMLYYGNNPMVIIRQIGISDNYEELTHLRYRADMLMLSELRNPDSLPWFSEVLHDLNRAFLKRVIDLAMEDLRTDGQYPPQADYCWIFAGMGGRKELFTRTAMDRGVVYQALSGTAGSHALEFFPRLGKAVSDGLLRCGWTPNTRNFTEANPLWCQSLEAWESTIHHWINHEDEEGIAQILPWFDTLPASGHDYLADSFEGIRFREISSRPSFIKRLASVTLESIPDASFYEGFSPRLDGESRRRFDLAQGVLVPLVNLARLFALRKGIVHVTSTSDRFKKLARNWKSHRAVFEDAAEAFRFSLFCSARKGLRDQSPGNLAEPATLSPIEQQTIKSAFRVVVELQNLAEGLVTSGGGVEKDG